MELTRAYPENKRELDFKMEEWEKLNESPSNMEEKKMQYLFGMHPVLEAVKAGRKFDKVLF